MAQVYLHTYDLTNLALSFEKQHLDVVCLDIIDPDDDPEYGGPAALSVSGVNSSDPDFACDESIDSDDSLADLF